MQIDGIVGDSYEEANYVSFGGKQAAMWNGRTWSCSGKDAYLAQFVNDKISDKAQQSLSAESKGSIDNHGKSSSSASTTYTYSKGDTSTSTSVEVKKDDTGKTTVEGSIKFEKKW